MQKREIRSKNVCPLCGSEDIYHDVLVGEYVCCSCGAVLKQDEVVEEDYIKYDEGGGIF